MLMKIFSVLFAALFAASSTAQTTSSSAPVPHRFSTNHMDFSVDPRVDFAKFASGKWLANTPIPADKSRWGGFDELGQANWNALKGLLEETVRVPQSSGTPGAMVGRYFRAAMDANAINRAGVEPIKADMGRIEAIASLEDLAKTLAAFHNSSIGGLFGVSVGPDQKKSDINALYAGQGGLSLPSRDYYFSDQFENIRSNFVVHVAKMFVLGGAREDEASVDAKTVLEVEKSLAQNAKTPVELRDRVANYNKMPTAELAQKVRSFPFSLYLAERAITGPHAAEIIVGQPKFFESLQEQLTARSLKEWKTYLRYQLLSDTASHLSAPFEEEHFRFYSTILRGTPAMEPRWQRAARAIDSTIGEALGQLYVAKYYPAEARERMRTMITNIQAVMRERLQKLDWMTEATREKALAKFDRFVPRIGHPDKWRDYSAVQISDDYFKTYRSATQVEIARRLKKLGQPVDKSEWSMTPPTVNAYFQATANQIVFPAGILQPPFFDFTLDDAVNYGAIGAVIGHEITHGFDDQGRRYDAEGNLTDWWTKEDETRFQARAQKVVDQYAQYEALPGLKLNGQLSLGENIADLGGTSIALEALQRHLANKKVAKIDGFTPEQRFFLSWAQQWRTAYREDALRRQVTVGPHSPGQFRAIGPLVNTPEFYDAFGIKEGDPMYRKPEDRAKIW